MLTVGECLDFFTVLYIGLVLLVISCSDKTSILDSRLEACLMDKSSEVSFAEINVSVLDDS